MTRARLLVQGSALRIANLFLGIAIAFFMMPYLVRHLGERMYGVWVLIGSLLGYYGLLDVGLSSAVARFISRAVGRNDREDIRRVTSTSFYIFAAMGVAAILLTVGLAAGMGYVVHDPSDRRIFRIIVLLLGLNYAFDFPVRAFTAVFSSNLREDVSNVISVLRTVMSAGFTFLAIEKGGGIVGLAVVIVACSMASNVARVVMAYRVEPNMAVSPRYFDRSKMRSLFGYSIYTFVGRIADIFRFKLDHLVITAFVSLRAVTHYAVAMRLFEYLTELITQMVGVVGPMFSQDEGRGDYEAIRRKFLFVTKISVYVALFFGGTTVLYARDFIQRWMGADFTDSYTVLVIIMVPLVLAMMQRPVSPLLFGISKHKYITYSNLLEGLANLGLSLALVRRYGMTGVALGTAIPMALMAVVAQPVYACRAIRLSRRRYAGLLVRNALVGLAALALGWLLVGRFSAPHYGYLAACVSVQTLIYWPVAIRFGFLPEERDLVLGVIREMAGFSKLRAESLKTEQGLA
jgi:O-antigen/teichoic acid export membrane protein